MPGSLARQLVDAFARAGWDAEPYALLPGVIAAGGVGELVTICLDELERAPTFFADALQFLPEEEFAAAVERAVSGLAGGRGREPAEEVVLHASLQFPHLLAPHLAELWELRPNRHSYAEMWPWRAAGAGERERLLGLLPDERAALALLESRDVEIVERVLASDWAARLDPGALAQHVRLVGLEIEPDGLRPLAPQARLHLAFPPELLADRLDGPLHLRPEMSPTWFAVGDAAVRARWGGTVANPCGLCHAPLHRLIELDPVPAGLGVSLPAVELATCLSCVGWEADVLFCRHDAAGRAFAHQTRGRPVTPGFPSDPFTPATVGLVPTPPRWRHQDWGTSNGRQNLNRLGGEPAWVQEAGYPACPSCASRMAALLQLDSVEGWLWGSGGLGYVTWCDRCAISGVLWQCT